MRAESRFEPQAQAQLPPPGRGSLLRTRRKNSESDSQAQIDSSVRKMAILSPHFPSPIEGRGVARRGPNPDRWTQ